MEDVLLDLKGTSLAISYVGGHLAEFVLFIFSGGYMSLLKLLASSNYISVNKTLIKAIGLEEAVILGELCSEYEYWLQENKLTEDGMFYCTSERMEYNTGLSEHQQRKAIQSLKNAGIIDMRLRGLPATKHFKINEDTLFEILQTSSEEIKELVPKKLNSSKNIDNKNIIKKPLIDKSIKDGGVEIQTFVNLYNELCTNLPRCVKITDKRSKAIKTIIKKYSLNEIKEVFTKANDSEFLTGNNSRGWKADIDFILREDKFIGILENKYSGKQKLNSKAGTDVGLHLNRVADKKKFREDVANGKAEKF